MHSHLPPLITQPSAFAESCCIDPRYEQLVHTADSKIFDSVENIESLQCYAFMRREIIFEIGDVADAVYCPIF